ncbi:type I restriction endonuclease subunit R [Wohlfahrtiimonas sp. G9077]|uniref:type I restriction endonuclease subunit R n=1 Tax=Wohlfahrtiimonas sp. G9077 TaxID=1980118 RepID=UPI000B99AAB0|nr:type I restriction endonuclease subunit R [Wohlfahrtiimonas sp. G9077]OYQ75120.1 DEAD/DEAH box helicase [Wohlfahrtiimonas sp. G9077]
MKNNAPKFQEEYSAKIPALTLLANLGWTFISSKASLELREQKTDQVILKSILKTELKKRTFTYGAKQYPLSDQSIDFLLNQICQPGLNEGLMKANERIYNHLLYGIAVTEFIDGKKISPTIAIIDWQNISNNSFLYTEEFTVSRMGAESRRPDIVCFVNGIPLVIIEAKRPDNQGKKSPTIDEGISQSLRNQRHNEIPLLFTYSQLLLSINGSDGRYGTCGTPKKFWASWDEEDISEIEMSRIKNSPVDPQTLDAIFQDRRAIDRQWFNGWSSGTLQITSQDKLIISLLSPNRLLEFIRFFIIFDQRHGKIAARYQQFFGIKRLLERIEKKRPDGGREGGVIWHTTGSGKSLTMVFLSKALILYDGLKQCRIIVVTDRTDLERQLSLTFAQSGALENKQDQMNAMATSGKRLAEQIGHGNERIIFSLIQKFNSATKQAECHNDSADIIVLIDEGHRSQGGENHIRMKQALPNASFIAFTGTPLLKDDKTTNKFGPILHAYTMQRATDDKTVTPLLYEERVPDLDVNERAIDTWFDRITANLTEAQKQDLKKKYSRKGALYATENRIELIALDIASHFDDNIADGLKGQLACDSKLSAILYKKYLDEVGLFESAVIMSPPDTREGNIGIDDHEMPIVAKWWLDHVGNMDEIQYTDMMVKRFADANDPLKMLIVVDKLLTGFDEPKNAVLYIDKPLKEHNLIQAIARVNRLHDQKEFGLLIDYRGILAELDTTIAKYQDLASRTQGGYDIDDLDGLYRQMSSEYKRLPMLYQELWAIFKDVENPQDIEQLRQVLVPKMMLHHGEYIDIHQQVRDDFYDALSEFASCLKVALQSATFFEDHSFSDEDRRHYKETVKQFTSLRQLAQQDAGERIDYDEYAEQVKKLLNKHVVGVEIQNASGTYEVNKMGQPTSSNPDDWSDDKTRNETDIIKTRITRMIEQELVDDPYAQETFSQLLRHAIEEAKNLFDHPLKQYMLFHEFEQKVAKRQLNEVPNVFNGNQHAQAYYGLFRKTFPALFNHQNHNDQKWIDLSLWMDQEVDSSVAENSINPPEIESSIRKRLLPKLFTECKSHGYGMDQARNIIEQVVQIVRVGLAR